MKTALKCSTILWFVSATGGQTTFGGAGCPCNGDVNGSGAVTPLDRTIVVSCVGCNPCEGACVNSDVNCDGTTDYIDLGVVDCQFRGMQDCCSKPFGACLLPDGHSATYPDCLVTLQTACELFNWGSIGGTYLGDGADCPGPPANDACADAIVIQPGSTPFTTIAATTDGPNPVPTDFGPSNLGRDVWYQYVPTTSGSELISLCQDTNYDAMLAVYGDGTATCTCPSNNANLIASNDDGCGNGQACGCGSKLTVSLTAGNCYLIRVGGFDNDQGTGTIVVGCNSTICDDGNDCTTDACVSGQCQHNFAPSGTPCTGEGNDCIVSWTCNGNGSCSVPNTAKPDETPCEDGFACSSYSECASGTCTPVVLTCCDLDVYPLTLCCSGPAECSDGNPCTADDCVDFFCTHTQMGDCMEVTLGRTRFVRGRVLDFTVVVWYASDEPSSDVKLIVSLQPWFHFVSSDPPPAVVKSNLVLDGQLEDIERQVITWNVPGFTSSGIFLVTYKARLDEDLPLGFEVGTHVRTVPADFIGWEQYHQAIVERNAQCDIACSGDVLAQSPNCTDDPLPCLIAASGADGQSCSGCYSNDWIPGTAGKNAARAFCDDPDTPKLEVCCDIQTGEPVDNLSCNQMNQLCMPIDLCLYFWTPDPEEESEAPWTGPTQGPSDPNDKIVAADAFVHRNRPLVYTVRFENVGDIEALDVFVDDSLAPELDASTLEILTPGASYDSGTRELRWDLIGINLPPGVTDSVSFAITPDQGLSSGTEIRNDASIQFEVLDPIITNEVVNTIDEVAPECIVQALPASSNPWFELAWSGSDAVGEIKEYSLFVSEDNGPFELHEVTQENSLWFTGIVGQTYGFLCTAKDTAGNIEAPNSTAEASTTIVEATDTTAPNLVVSAVTSPTCVRVQLIRGTASDPIVGGLASTVSLVTVNDAPASLDPQTGEFTGLVQLSPGANELNVRAVDYAGNESNQIVSITLDDGPPSVSCGPDVFLFPQDETGAPTPDVMVLAAASDDCDIAPDLTQDPPVGHNIGLGEQVITVTAIDLAGNSAQCTTAVTVAALPVQPDPSGIDKTRFISFTPPVELAGQETALRVRLTSLHHVSPPYTGGPVADFSSFEGQVRWVGPPVQYIESNSEGAEFFASHLQCTPHYQDWGTVGLLHVTGSAIVPSSFYEVENVAASCQGIEASCTGVSEPLMVTTTRWGDVEEPYNPPSATIQPDLADVSALVNKFRNAPGAPIKVRALLVGVDAAGTIDIAPDFSFIHIAGCVDAFRGRPYPHSIEACP